MNTNKRYSPEVRKRAVRLVLFEQQGEHDSQWTIHTAVWGMICAFAILYFLYSLSLNCGILKTQL